VWRTGKIKSEKIWQKFKNFIKKNEFYFLEIFFAGAHV